jgi:hypothetical protein
MAASAIAVPKGGKGFGGAAPLTAKFEPVSVWKTAFSVAGLVNQS